jgi:EAL domain-containing protein (putative c-di-GMP-specific phosphodiesterase class I)/GGDEF domain-containing protein
MELLPEGAVEETRHLAVLPGRGGRNASAPAVPIPANESDRLAALRRFELLDTPPEPVFDQITRLASKLLNVPIALITLVDEDRQWFKSRVGLAVPETPREHAFCGHAIMTDDLFVIEDAMRDPRFDTNPLVTGNPHIRFYAGAPLRGSDGLALGTMCVIDTKPRSSLTPDEAEMLRNLAAMVMAHIETRQAVGYIQPETGLSNRFRFLKDLDNFIVDPERATPRIAVIVIKMASPGQHAELIRTLGHAVADAFEVAATRQIMGALPPKMKLYHLTGARFACIPAVTTDTEMAAFLDRLTSAIGKPTLFQDIPLMASRGIGVAEFPENGDDGMELLRAATSAAHESLEEEKPCCRYNVIWDQRRQRDFRLLRDLALAIAESGQLSVVYQPKIDLRTLSCIGAEALVRWTHPELGPISPAEFIPLAERTALIRALTDWVFATVLTQVAQWRAAGLGLRISINVSMLDLDDDAFAGRLAALLGRHGVQPAWIDIEVTESALMKDRARVGRQLREIRQLGIGIEIDDFGTGQSALSYLKQIPASYVKIDQLFVRSLDSDTNDQKMVRSTIDLVHDLGFGVVAEGVETMEVHDWLRDHGCDIGQGYVIARPLDPLVFEAWLRAGAAICAPVGYDELELAFQFVSSGSPMEHRAFIVSGTGAIWYESDWDDNNSDPGPEETPSRLIAIPHKNDLDLGRSLVFRFMSQALPSHTEQVAGFFRGKGAYGRFKDLLLSQGLWEGWHAFEDEMQGGALRDWCAENGIPLVEDTGEASP